MNTIESAHEAFLAVYAQVATGNGGRPGHCRHRDNGVCVTKAGNIRTACLRDVEATMTGPERWHMHGQDIWVFPTIGANIATTRDPRVQTAKSAISRATMTALAGFTRVV
ncbi:hypothetical protein FOS14_19710 [Skermania sp. ID1734]|uniref:hypothetical protein n=1 Tax=Skermania sp. ID1734 TaxID=2597516 RepID=UPI00117C64F7|nr:hypothetical protein [Skermania sp. ID1734]TSD94870.1 hypothetical protein FOS14_19710 [Skermania sp. ID1734]